MSLIEETVVSMKNISMVYKLFNSPNDRLKEALSPFRTKYHKDFFALNNINLEIKKGDILGIIGRNGSGKSTLLKIIASILAPSQGSIETKGRIIPLLELGAGFNSEFTGLENIYFYCSIQGMTKRETEKVIPQILDFCEIGEFIYQPVKTYSSGMFARLAFAVSLNVDPDILIVDEILSVGDALFQKKSLAKMEQLMYSGKTVIYVSHSDQSVINLCNKAIFLDNGNLMLQGTPKFVAYYYSEYLNLVPEKQKDLKEKFLSGEIKDTAEKQEKKFFFDFTKSSYVKDKFDFIPRYEELFNPNLLIKGTALKNADVDLVDIRIENKEGKVLNQILYGNEYLVKFRAIFNEHIHKAIFTCAIRDKDGVLFQRFASPGFFDAGKFYQDIKKGSFIEISFNLPCIFSPGIYFIGLGVVGEYDSKILNLNFILDCLPFEVKSNYSLNFDYPIGIIKESNINTISMGAIEYEISDFSEIYLKDFKLSQVDFKFIDIEEVKK